MGPDGALTALCWEPKCSKCRATGKFISELDRIKTLLCLWTLQEQVTVRVCFSDFFFVWGKVFFLLVVVVCFSYGSVPCIFLAWYEICFSF